MRFPSLFVLLALAAAAANAQYTKQAGRSAAQAEPLTEEVEDGQGRRHTVVRNVEPPRDKFGNASSSNYDLAVDGAFDGQTVMLVDLYHSAYHQDFSNAAAALKRKGFSVVRYGAVPKLEEFRAGLKKANQFWIVSSCDNTVHLSKEHQQAVRQFFEQGHGVYLWGDNDPCNADADSLAKQLIDARVSGNLPGDQTVGISRGPTQPGVVRDHLLSTGVETVYEGITVATVKPAGAMTPVIYGSAGNLVAAAFEKDGKRLLVDGGFTRLAFKWDTAGTGRYIMNAVAWLANHERFGDAVVAEQFRKR